MSTTTTLREALPGPLAPYTLEAGDVLRANDRKDEKPGRDPLGTPGMVQRTMHVATVTVQWPRRRVTRALTEAGLTVLRTGANDTELERERHVDEGHLADPFLLEDSIRVVVKGREFPGQQRSILEAKVEALEREVDDPATTPERKTKVEGMLRDLGAGLASSVEYRSVVRRFQPAVSVRSPVESIGKELVIAKGTRIVYSVRSPGEKDEDVQPMAFHVLNLGEREAIVVFTGGLHGMRHLRDMDESCIHDAWFANRERIKTDATAPWLGRKVLRDLLDTGKSHLVVHSRRDREPTPIAMVEEDIVMLRVDGEDKDVPVLTCKTDLEDELVVLNDVQNPLVLRLEEKGVDLVRTVDEILSPA